MRHSADPDHLAVIDGLVCIPPRPTNDLDFAPGHILVVMFLAIGIGHFLASQFAFAGSWSLIVICLVSLWRLRRGVPAPPIKAHPVIVQPFFL